MNKNQPQTVIITGASGGIGGACADAFHAAGANVVLADVAEAGNSAMDRFDAERSLFVRCDVSNEACVRELVLKTVGRFGALDVLVNNAAVLAPTAPIHETSDAEFE